jgi:hypothetical protein
MDAGYLADVRDLSLTTSYSSSEDLTDLALALAPPVPKGGPGVTLVIRARFYGRAVDVAKLATISLRAHYRLRSDDRQRAARSLTDMPWMSLHLDPDDPNGITLPFPPSTVGYAGFTGAGEEIPVCFFEVTPEVLRALGLAKAVSGEVLWTNFVLTPQEVDALQRFARRVLPPIPRAGGVTTTTPQPR